MWIFLFHAAKVIQFKRNQPIGISRNSFHCCHVRMCDKLRDLLVSTYSMPSHACASCLDDKLINSTTFTNFPNKKVPKRQKKNKRRPLFGMETKRNYSNFTRRKREKKKLFHKCFVGYCLLPCEISFSAIFISLAQVVREAHSTAKWMRVPVCMFRRERKSETFFGNFLTFFWNFHFV